MEKVSNSNTSAYAGNLSNDFQSTCARDLEQGSKYGLVGMTSLLSGRLSWFFNLLGPCLTLDTACSSSLVALDLGCQTLYTGTSDMVSYQHIPKFATPLTSPQEYCHWVQLTFFTRTFSSPLQHGHAFS